MHSNQIRKNWIEFFTSSKKHKLIPSASLVPKNPTLLLVNAGMVPFVPYFLGEEAAQESRQVSIQKCVRLGGKDSDLENIGHTPRHLSFFEMLGNFSFGDYFKEEAILWAWELLTEVFELPADKLLVSVFAGDPELGLPADQLAWEIWKNKLKVPEERILRLSSKDNFWGPPGGLAGPCGPCSEIYYQETPQSEAVEIWNLVFMELEKQGAQTFVPLQKKNIDTGAGLERLACVLQKKENVFQTDLLAPLLDFLENKNISAKISRPEQISALKIIADHFRCTFMLLLDGVLPSNSGRGYITRMLIRRASRFARLLALEDFSLTELLSSCSEIFAEAYPETLDRVKLSQLKKIILEEENCFRQSLERGLLEFEKLIKKSKTSYQNSRNREDRFLLCGESVFDLHATYGFPLELTIDLARENQLEVDLFAYQRAKEKHAQLSDQKKFAHKLKAWELNLATLRKTEDQPKYQVGCSSEKALNFQAELQAFKINQITEVELIFDQTCFYAESGGQLGDKGSIVLDPLESGLSLVGEVLDTQKLGEQIVHKVAFAEEFAEDLAEILEELRRAKRSLSLEVDLKRRKELAKHHTATHLLQAALKKNLKSYGKQAGSRVESEKSRFDFTHPHSLSQRELKIIEEQINTWIQADLPVETLITDYATALELGALAFEEESYDPQVVRVLRIGDQKETASIELCGGTHVQRTSEIGAVKILLESSISAQTRRIEMLAGKSAIDYLLENSAQINLLSKELKTQTTQVAKKVGELKDSFKVLQKSKQRLERKLLNYQAQELLANSQKTDQGVQLIFSQVTDLDLRELSEIICTKLKSKFLIFLVNQNKEQKRVNYLCKLSKDLLEFNAKELTDFYSKIINGNSGGNQFFSQGGSSNLDLAKEKISALKDFIKNKIKALDEN